MNTHYYDWALNIIESYIWDLKSPRIKVRDQLFKQLSYRIWAAEELYDFVCKNDNVPPLEAVEQFIKKMDHYACLNSSNSFMFSVAHDTAEDVMDILLAAI